MPSTEFGSVAELFCVFNRSRGAKYSFENQVSETLIHQRLRTEIAVGRLYVEIMKEYSKEIFPRKMVEVTRTKIHRIIN